LTAAWLFALIVGFPDAQAKPGEPGIAARRTPIQASVARRDCQQPLARKGISPRKRP